MTATVTAKPAPTDIAIDTETGQIGTVAELEAARAVMPPAAVEVVKPDTVPRDVVAEAKPAAVEAPAAEAETAPAPNAAAEAAARLRARGAARRSRIDREAQVRGVQSTLERRLADTARALKDAEARAAEAERQTLPALQARGEAGKALAQAAPLAAQVIAGSLTIQQAGTQLVAQVGTDAVQAGEDAGQVALNALRVNLTSQAAASASPPAPQEAAPAPAPDATPE